MWHEQRGQETLVNMQASIILCDIMSHNGEDKKGSSFLVTSCQLARSMNLLRDPSMWNGRPQETNHAANWYRARACAVWGLFAYQGYARAVSKRNLFRANANIFVRRQVAYSLQRSPMIRKPPAVEKPYANEESDINSMFGSSWRSAASVQWLTT